MSPEVKRIEGMFEPQKTIINKTTLEETYSQSPILLRLMDEVRTYLYS